MFLDPNPHKIKFISKAHSYWYKMYSKDIMELYSHTVKQAVGKLLQWQVE